jgi:hypothetical protein
MNGTSIVGTVPMSNPSITSTVKNDIVKTHIIQQIDNLKTDIQNLLDKKKIIPKDEIGNWNKVKNEKMTQLKVLTEKLKGINKQERLEIKNNNEITKISKTIDNLEYAAAKKKNNSIAMDKAKREKELRNEAREQYTKFQNMEQKYLEYDSDKLPGNLFLHKDILKSYGLCPFIDIEFDKENECLDKKNITQEIYNKRFTWLQTQMDKGKLYFELYDDLIMRTKSKVMSDNKIVLEKAIYNFIKQNITESQMNMYDCCIDFIEEYVNCNIKTKRIKERYNVCVNNLSVLYSETSMEFHTYLSSKYNIHIVVNILTSNVNLKDQFLIKEEFDDLIKKYKMELEDIEKNTIFIKNTLRNIKTDLYSFLTDKQSFVNKLSNTNLIKSNSVVQVGKYFKRWSVLTKQEQFDRFESFSNFYVDKHLVNTLIIEKQDRDKMVETLFNLLITNFENRRMVYRDYVWNTTRGLIENVKILRYNKDTGFTLVFSKQMPSKDGQLKKQQEQEKKLSTEETESSEKISKKKISSRTIITKDSEKIINEELLYFILTRIQNGVDSVNQEDKDSFCEKIKTKLKVKKLMLNDKTKIHKKYDEIFEVVKNNKT